MMRRDRAPQTHRHCDRGAEPSERRLLQRGGAGLTAMWRSQMSPALRPLAFRDLAGLGDDYAVSGLIRSAKRHADKSTENFFGIQVLSHFGNRAGASNSL